MKLQPLSLSLTMLFDRFITSLYRYPNTCLYFYSRNIRSYRVALMQLSIFFRKDKLFHAKLEVQT